MKLKDSKNCRCNWWKDDSDTASSVKKPCRAGYCTIALCPFCGLTRWDAGPVACPHKKNENGTLRWYKYPDMDKKAHVAVKGNAMRRKRSYHKR